jgi:uncharacterized Zn finger protein
MSRYHGGWAPYVPVAARRRKAEREIEKLRKKGAEVSPVKIEGRQIATTFWGKAWCGNLESYRDYESRLPRGRTYVRNGSVVDLRISPREVTALVSGSEIYKVKVSIGDLAKARWKMLCADCSGGIDSLVELLQGRFSKGVMERICRQDTGLFPRPSEIRFACSCLDHASMCKHVAAVLYGVGARLDQSPELLFRLRAVDETELLSDLETALPTMRTEPDAAKTLSGDDLAALFGLDMAESETLIAIPPAADLSAAVPRRKPSGRVVENPAVVAAPMSVTKARTAKSAPASTVPLARPPQKTTTVAKTKSRSEPITAAAAKPGLDAPAKATVSTRRQTATTPVIATPVAMSEHRPRRPVSSDTAKPGVHQRRGHGKS